MPQTTEKCFYWIFFWQKSPVTFKLPKIFSLDVIGPPLCSFDTADNCPPPQNILVLRFPSHGIHSVAWLLCTPLGIPFFFFFATLCIAYGILVPRPGIEPMPAAVEAWSLNHWTAREVPFWAFLFFLFYVFVGNFIFCGTWDPQSSLGHPESLVAACGIYFPDQESSLGPLHGEHEVFATGPPGKSLFLF